MAYANLAIGVKNARANAITSAVGASGQLLIYAGVMPATPDTALSGDSLLCTLPCSATFAGAASNGVLTANPIAQENASATGTATFARLETAGGTVVMDVDISASGGGGSLQLNTTAIVSGGPVVITSFTITEA